MSLRILSLTLSLLILTSMSACKPEPENTQTANNETHNNHTATTEESTEDQSAHTAMEHEQADHGQSTTIVKQAGNTQVTFDISSMASHHKMMESMKMPMDHSNNTSHYVMVTLMDENKQLLKDIPIKIKALGPDGNSLGNEAGETMETMSAEGMFHYGYGFDFKTPGKYEIIVMFKHVNEVISTGTSWELK